MKYVSDEIEQKFVLRAAEAMCAAARTAPKTRGIDNIVTVILTGDDLTALADKMEEIDVRKNGANRTHFTRDAGNVRRSQAVVMIGVRSNYQYGLNCANCGFTTCAACAAAGGLCMFASTDLGIAVGSAVSTAAAMKVDSRVMYSAGKSFEEMDYADPDITWLGIPLSVSGKSIFFDRK